MMRRSWLLPVTAALLMFAAWPHAGIPLLIFTAWWPLFRLSDLHLRERRKWFFAKIYLTFFLFNLLTTYWIWFATPAGAVMAILANSLLMSLTFWIWHRARRRLPVSMAVVLFPVLWISFEKMHYVWDLEWPWLTMGNVWSAWPWSVQWYEYTGVFGGSLWVLAGALWFYYLTRRSFRPSRRWVPWLAFVFLPMMLSALRYLTYEEKGPEARVLILQPNIDPWTSKFDRPNTEMAGDLIRLIPPDTTRWDLILAPETALPQGMEIDRLRFRRAVEMLRDVAEEHQSPVLTGVSLYHILRQSDSLPPTANYSKRNHTWYQLYNSALFIRPEGDFSLYHKAILVPGAEKMPYRSLFQPLLGNLVLDLGGMSGTHTPSREPVVFRYGKLKVAPIICYESIFGDYVRRYVLKGANLLAVISNDGWWKRTSGYRQHFDYARLRAIETRRDVVRAANTGRSGLIDQRGRAVASLGYDRRGILDVRPHLNEAVTFYTRHGDYIARLALFLTALLLLYALLGCKKGGYTINSNPS